jgi:hypothetical protein
LHLNNNVYKQLQNSNTELELLLDEKTYTSKLDYQSCQHLRRHYNDLLGELWQCLTPPLDTAQNIGQSFKQKLKEVEAATYALISTRTMMSRKHEYPNLLLFINYIDNTQNLFATYGHKYRKVDSTIAIVLAP